MKCFLVLSLPEEGYPDISQKDVEKLTKNHVIIPRVAWIVADKDRTTITEVEKALNLGTKSDSKGATGLVISLTQTNINGFAPMELWQSLSTWLEE